MQKFDGRIRKGEEGEGKNSSLRGGEYGTTGNANDKNEWPEDAHLEVEDDYSGAGWEKAKTKREKRRGKSKSSLAEEYEALTL